MTSLRRIPAVSGSRLLARPLLAITLAITLAGGPFSPACAQDTPQNPPPAQTKPEPSVVPMSLGLAKHNFSHGPRAFPNLFAPYHSIKIEPTVLANSTRIDQLIHDNKLEIHQQAAFEQDHNNSVD